MRVTTFTTLDEAYAKLATGARVRRHLHRARPAVASGSARRLLQPLNLELIPNLEKTVWPELHSPAYDVGSRYSIPYTTYTTGIGWRNDLLDFDPQQARPAVGRVLGARRTARAGSASSTTTARRSAWR